MSTNDHEARQAIRRLLAAESRNFNVNVFADLCVLTVAIQAYASLPDADPAHVERGFGLVRRGAATLEDGFNQLVIPLGERSDAGAIKTLIQRATGGSIPIQTQRRAELYLRMFPWLQSRGALFQDVFPGRSTRPSRMLAVAVVEEDPRARLRALAAIPSCGAGGIAGRRWMEQAAQLAGVGVPASAGVLADADTVTSRGQELGRVQRALAVADPMSDEAADLQSQRDDIVADLEQVAETSADPSAVRATAVAATSGATTSKAARRFGLTPEQEQVVLTRGKVVVAAGAGSGKTATLVATIVHLVEEEGYHPGQILACSFTRAASAELAERTESKGGIQGVDIGTTHSVARAIIKRNRPDLVQVVGKTKEADRLFKMAMKQVAMDLGELAKVQQENQRLMEQIEGIRNWESNDFLQSLYGQLARGRKLSEKQLAVLERFSGGGGGGYGGGGGGYGGRRRWASGKVSPYWTTPAGQWFNIGAELIDENGKPVGEKWGKLQVENLKNSRVSVEQARQEHGDAHIVTALYGAYEWLKAHDPVEGPAMDYTDQLIVALEILENDPIAREREQRRYKAVMVDEAQDLNEVQFRMFKIIGEKADTLSFIGDDKQSIYAFRGAKPQNYVELSKDAGFQTRLMTMNFRSGSAIVNSANKLIAHNEDRQIRMVCQADEDRRGIGAIHAKDAPSHEEGCSLVAQEIKDSIDAGASPKDFGILVRNNAEADMYTLALLTRGVPYRMLKKSQGGYFGRPVVRAMVAWMRMAVGGSPNDINDAVMTAHMTPGFGLDKVFASQLARMARGNYLDYVLRGGEVYSGNAAWMNKRVKEYATAIMRVRSASTESAEALISEILSLKGAKGTFEDSLMSMVDDDDLIEEDGGEVTEETKRAAAMAPLRPLNIMAAHFGDPANMLRFIDKMKAANERTQKKTPDDKEDWKEPAVLVGTVHSWKGLQAKHCYVSMAGGIFPNFRTDAIAEAQSASGEPVTAYDEERRLAYVALTRGEDTVTVMTPQTNYLGRQSTLSRFVTEACIPIVGDSNSGGSDPGGDVSGAVDVGDMDLDAESEVLEMEHMNAESRMASDFVASLQAFDEATEGEL